MNNEEIQKNEVAQTQDKPKRVRNYNGLYRKNSRSVKNKETSIVASDNENLDVSTIAPITNNEENIDSLIPEIDDIKHNPKTVTIKSGTRSKPLNTAKKHNPNQKNKNNMKSQHVSKNVAHVNKDETNHITELDAVEEVNTYKRSPYHEVLFLIRQRYEYNHNEFFSELEKVLKEIKFSEIEESNLNLFGFAFLYERELILNGLCEKYADEITQKDLDRTFKYCFTKRTETMQRLIQLYSSKFIPSHEFMNNLFNTMSICSYRSGINSMLLEWLAPFCEDETFNTFWKNCIEHRNIPLMQVAMENAAFKNYMNVHFSEHEESLKIIGRDFSIRNMLGKKQTSQQNVFNDTPLVATTYLGNEAEQQKQNNQMLTQTDKKTVVVFKAKKTAD